MASRNDKTGKKAPEVSAGKPGETATPAAKAKARVRKKSTEQHAPHPVFGVLDVDKSGALGLRTDDGKFYALDKLAQEAGAELTLKLKLSQSQVNVSSLTAGQLKLIVLFQQFLVERGLETMDGGATCCHAQD